MKRISFLLILCASSFFVSAQKNGLVMEHDKKGRVSDSSFYVNGVRTIYAAYSYFANDAVSTYEFKDSLRQIGIYRSFDSATAKLNIDANYKPGGGSVTTEVNGKMTTRPSTSVEMREAEFAGGSQGWKKFLIANLDPNAPIRKRARAGTYQVVARFIVNENGTLSDIKAETDFGHGMEKEVLRLLKQSPDWIPALLYGVPVKAYRRQPVTFVVSEE